MNFVFTIIFSLEMIMKIIVFGMITNGQDSYLRNGWNILDSVIVFVSITCIVLEDLSKRNPTIS